MAPARPTARAVSGCATPSRPLPALCLSPSRARPTLPSAFASLSPTSRGTGRSSARSLSASRSPRHSLTSSLSRRASRSYQRQVCSEHPANPCPSAQRAPCLLLTWRELHRLNSRGHVATSPQLWFVLVSHSPTVPNVIAQSPRTLKNFKPFALDLLLPIAYSKSCPLKRARSMRMRQTRLTKPQRKASRAARRVRQTMRTVKG